MDIPAVFTIAFTAACALSLYVGIYTLYINPHSRTNILFFVMSVTIGIWSFGLGMAISAGDLAVALFWRRFSALGWGAFFSVLLHFFQIFTGDGTPGKNRWRSLFLYLPTVVTYLGFTYIPQLNPGQYNLILTDMGWINVAVNNAWDWFYMAYYMLYSVASFFIVWRWGRKSGNPRTKKQSHLIFFSFVITMIVGSLTDILGNLIFSEKIPQLAPLLMVVPVFVVYYSIKKYGLMNTRHTDEESILMSDQIRTKMTNYMSNAFLFAALVNIISQYLLGDNVSLGAVFLFSGGLIFIGILLQVIQRSVKNKQLKDVLNAIIFSLIVPVLTFLFIDYAGVTIWAFPFILLIVTLIYGRIYIQITLSISILMTQAVVWLIRPEAAVTVNGIHHVIRLSLSMIAIWFAWFVKNVFQSKLRENAEQLRSQTIITEISSDFVSVNERNLDEKIERAFSNTVTFLKTERAYIYLFDEKKENLTCRSIWFDQTKMEKAVMNGVIDSRSFPRFTTFIKAGKPIAVSEVTDVFSETCDELPRILGSNEKSFAAIPVMINNEVYGFFGIDAEPKIKKWPETQLAFIKILSNILGDAIEKIQKENEITEMAFHDYLTKLPNRILFKDRVAQAISAAERTEKPLAVIFLDLDAFKAVNDSVGHDGGDALLIKMAEKLTELLCKQDVLSRFGGDEFLILLDNLNTRGDIPKIVEEILSICDRPFVLDGQEIFVTGSAGIAVWPQDGADPEALIKNADIAMYKAKEQGRNGYLFCTPDMKEEIRRKNRLRTNLFRALERHELQVYYQPQVSVQTKKVIGAEALVRWFHPEDGMISPGLFIPLAEQSGLIGPIGDWVLMTTCLQCKTWQLQGLPEVRIGVNVSALQLRNPEFVYRVGQILEETQLAPQHLELEITESAAVREADYIIEVLANLKKLGVSISIDDFGTEYSSLSRLTTMPIDRVKLDMQFIRGIDRSEKEKAIIRGIISLTHNLGLKVIAEGVETELQVNFLEERQCDEIQGYYFSRPVQPEVFEKILRDSL